MTTNHGDWLWALAAFAISFGLTTLYIWAVSPPTV